MVSLLSGLSVVDFDLSQRKSNPVWNAEGRESRRRYSAATNHFKMKIKLRGTDIFTSVLSLPRFVKKFLDLNQGS
jgi:hypothetical protein